MKRALTFLGIGVLGAVAMTLSPAAARPADATTCIRIYEIYYNSPGTDTRTNTSLNGEWIRLHNACSTAKSLTGWTIRDLAGHTYTFGTYGLKGYGYVKVHTGKGTNTSTDRYWGSGNYIWNNDKDTAYLRNSAGTLIAGCAYNNASVAYKYC